MREAALHNTLERFVAPRTSVSLPDLANEVCPQGDCTSPSAGFDPAWRFDGLHYDIFGAFWFAEWVTPSFRALPEWGVRGLVAEPLRETRQRQETVETVFQGSNHRGNQRRAGP